MKPMLSATVEDLSSLRFPYLASPKLDGVRALIIDGIVMSRSLKPIPNKHVQKLFGKKSFNGYDGELIVGCPKSPNTYRNTTSGVMSEDGEPDVCFYVFDNFHHHAPFIDRLNELKYRSVGLSIFGVSFLDHVEITDHAALQDFELYALGQGYEGVMLRSYDGQYKHGRATLRNNSLLKLKRFLDNEAVIIGCEELMINDNPPTINELGRQERSSHKANMRPGNTLGKLIVKGLPNSSHYADVEFSIGSGFTDELRRLFWSQADSLIGKIITYKHFPIGVKDKPRHPVFLRIREDLI